MYFSTLWPCARRFSDTGINTNRQSTTVGNSDIGSLDDCFGFFKSVRAKQRQKNSFFRWFFKAGRNGGNLCRRSCFSFWPAKGVDKTIGIGEVIVWQQQMFKLLAKFFASPDDFTVAALSDFAMRPFCWPSIDYSDLKRSEKCFCRKRANSRKRRDVISMLVHNLNYYRSRIKTDNQINGYGKSHVIRKWVLRLPTILSVSSCRLPCCCIPQMKVSNSWSRHHPSDHGDELKCKVLKRWFCYRLEPEMHNFRLLNQLNEVLRKHDGDPFRNPYQTGHRNAPVSI